MACLRAESDNIIVLAALLCRLVNIHVIDTLGVAKEEVHRCIECWCASDEARLHGKHGGGECCSEALCPAPHTTLHTYFLQFDVIYR